MAIRAEELGYDKPDDRAGAVDIDRDRLLVLRHQRGDAGAFDELYRRYHDRLVGYCERRVGDRHVAEELAQEAFLRALRAMPRFAGERRFYPWMTVIAQRLCIDHHRKTARVEPAAEVDGGWVEPDHDALWAQVDRLHLNEALARLAPRHREILDLREARGWSYQQIADHLDVPLTTVEALLHRARKALRREFVKVRGDEHVAALGAAPVLVGVGVLAKLKAWLAGLVPEKLAPAIGAAAAGIAAAGVVVGPLTPPAIEEQQLVTADSSTVVEHTPATAPPATTGADDAVLGSVSVQPAAGATATDAPPTTPSGAPGTIDAGAVVIYVGPEASAEAADEAHQLPLGGELGTVSYGMDPAELVASTEELIDFLLGGSEP